MSMLRTDAVPRVLTALDSRPGVSAGMPASTAASTTLRAPMSRVRSTYAVLIDCSVALTRSTVVP